MAVRVIVELHKIRNVCDNYRATFIARDNVPLYYLKAVLNLWKECHSRWCKGPVIFWLESMGKAQFSSTTPEMTWGPYTALPISKT